MATEPKDLNPDKRNRLVDAVRDIKIAAAERNDVVIEMKEADRARIEILAQELEPVFSDVPADDERFDFAISSGLQPRLWIDATAHVIMGKDRRQYRFVRDTRLGRVVLAESHKTAPVSDAVTKYIAERLYERELALAGDDVTYRSGVAQRLDTPAEPKAADHADAHDDEGETFSLSKAAKIAQNAETKKTEPATIVAKQDRESKTSMSPIGWLLLGLFLGAGVLMLTFRQAIFAGSG